jgi:hypothetical protein
MLLSEMMIAAFSVSPSMLSTVATSDCAAIPSSTEAISSRNTEPTGVASWAGSATAAVSVLLKVGSDSVDAREASATQGGGLFPYLALFINVTLCLICWYFFSLQRAAIFLSNFSM